MIHYRRELRARQLVEALQGKVVFSDAHNGLFLTALVRS